MRKLALIPLLVLGLGLVGCTDEGPVTGPPTDPAGVKGTAQGSESADPSSNAVEIEAIDLGTLGGNSWAVGINDAGQVVGLYRTASGEAHAFFWEDGTITDLGVPGQHDVVYAINAAGQAVGWTQTPSYEHRAILWENGERRELGTLGGTMTEPFDINDAGQVVGRGTIPSYWRAFLWENGSITGLSTLGGAYSGAEAINNAGQVVGSSTTASNVNHAVLWENGTIRDLGTLEESSRATDINEAGQVVGYSGQVANNEWRVVLWENGTMIDLFTTGLVCCAYNYPTINEAGHVIANSYSAIGEGQWLPSAIFWEDGTMTELGTLGGSYSQAFAINNAGQVVGVSTTATSQRHAFLWEDGTMTELGTLGGASSLAWDINEVGHAVGYGQTASGEVHATLWRTLSPLDRVERIAADVEALETAGILNHGQAYGLTNRLNVATAMVNDGKVTPAVNMLEAFINEVEALIESGILTSDEGEPLINAAQVVIEDLG